LRRADPPTCKPAGLIAGGKGAMRRGCLDRRGGRGVQVAPGRCRQSVQTCSGGVPVAVGGRGTRSLISLESLVEHEQSIDAIGEPLVPKLARLELVY
jgi:hypothetical protein